MRAIAKRELKAYFSSPIGYVCIGVLSALFGYYFYQVLLSGSTYYLSSVYNMMFMWGMMVIPLITMKSMSEDRKNRTDQMLLTSQVGLYSLVAGKFLAALTVYAIGLALSLFPCLVISFYADLSWGIVCGNVLGSLLYAGAMISIGIFLSSLTESQIIAAVSTFGVSIVLMVIDQMAFMLQNDVLETIVGWTSFSSRFVPFAKGILDVSSIVFFLSVAVGFLFLTARKLESRRWN